MELLTSVTESLILAGASWAILQALANQPAHQEELLPIPVKERENRSHSADRQFIIYFL
jgi:hypothetical protein